MTKPTDLTYFVSGFLAFELMSMQCSRCQRHGSAICSLHLHLTWAVFLFADGRSHKMCGSVIRVRKSESYTFQNGRTWVACCLMFWSVFSGAVTIVLLWTDDQIVRCGLRSLGRGRFEEMVAIGAVWVCVMRVFSGNFTFAP